MSAERSTSTEWMKEKTACRDDPELFAYFSPRTNIGQDRINEAKSTCNGCPVRLDCLNYAIDKGEPAGIWGGLDPKERNRLIRQRR